MGQKRSGSSLGTIAAVIGGVVLLYLVFGMRSPSVPPADARPIVALTVPEFQASWANEPGAKARYAANRVRLSGTVEGVTINATGDSALHLVSADPLQPMTAHFYDSEQPKLNTLVKGQPVTVTCGKGAQVMDIPVVLDCVLGG